MDTEHFNYYSKNGKNLPVLILNGIQLQYVQTFKYLGYTLNNSNTDGDHIATIFSKCRCKALSLRRYFRYTKDTVIIKLIKSYLISSLYGLELSHTGWLQV